MPQPTTKPQTEKEYADSLFRAHYHVIMETAMDNPNNAEAQDMSEEILVSVLAKKHALVSLTMIRKTTESELFYNRVRIELEEI